ncbi:MAG: hypothetical protein KC656_21780, partial [Myxococcales bacterium]|nr:hypothetical protein [Myxococcales bacterium]
RRALAAAQLAVREERAVAGLVEDALPALRRRARSVQRYVQAPVDSAQPAATREQALLDLLRGRATHATPPMGERASAFVCPRRPLPLPRSAAIR